MLTVLIVMNRNSKHHIKIDSHANLVNSTVTTRLSITVLSVCIYYSIENRVGKLVGPSQ